MQLFNRQIDLTAPGQIADMITSEIADRAGEVGGTIVDRPTFGHYDKLDESLLDEVIRRRLVSDQTFDKPRQPPLLGAV